jgi:hypothetical protein
MPSVISQITPAGVNRPDRPRPLLGADACPARDMVHRDRVRRLVRRRVVIDHRMQMEPAGHFGQDRHAEQPAPMRDHECDDLGGNLLRGRDEVSLVLAIFIVHDDDDTAVPQCLKRVFDLGIFFTHRHVLISDHSRANHLVSSLTVATSLDQLTLFYTNRPVAALPAVRPWQSRLP